jgi:glyoxylase-like metal-dependent hydrolase (beta-lactamase superfamily II)
VPEPFLPPLVRDGAAGVLRAALHTPFAAGAVNCYLLVGRPLTIVDPGTTTPESLDQVGALLAEAGCVLEDVEQVVVTHGHPDHFGAAALVARRAGAPVVTSRIEAPSLRGDHGGERRRALLRVLGVPPELVQAQASAVSRLRDVVEWMDGTPVVELDDGDTLTAGGHVMTAHVTAGHSPGHLSLWCEQRRVLLSGDHLLARVVPLPGLEPVGSGAGHRRSLQELLDSLDRFVDLDPAVVLPGHGEAFARMDVLAGRLRRHHADRCRTVRTIIEELGHPTPFEVAQRMLWQAEGGRLVRGVSEVIGHADLLELDGSVVAEIAPGGEDGEEPVLRYRIAS